MEIFCACPFAVAALGWEPAAGRHSVSVCVKATFVLVPGGVARLAPLQQPVRGDAPSADAPDLVPCKPRVDVLFTGHAHAPGGAPTDSLIARARVGTFRKSLSINGDRAWVPSFDGLRPSLAVPFRRMPLTYERAVRAGENLIGVDISQGAEPNRPLANIAAIADQGGETPGLGPIPFAWRALRLGLTDAATLWASRAGIAPGPPPPGVDFRIFNAAPAEQQIDELLPGTEVLLENLHPEQPRVETRLPNLRVRVFRRAPGSDASEEVPARCDTLWIDADHGLAIVLWRAAVLVESGEEAAVGRLVVTAESDAERIGAEDVDRMLARLAPDVTYIDPGVARGEPPRSYPPVADPIPVPTSPPEPPPAPMADDRTVSDPVERRPPATLAPPPDEAAASQALPFRSSAPRLSALDLSAPTTLSDAGDGAPTTWGSDDEDTEVTPARGYRPSLVSTPHAAPPPPPPEHAALCAVQMDLWQSGQPLGEVLARRGLDEAAFRAQEAAQRQALEREAAEGRADLAVALLDGLAAQRRS